MCARVCRVRVSSPVHISGRPTDDYETERHMDLQNTRPPQQQEQYDNNNIRIRVIFRGI